MDGFTESLQLYLSLRISYLVLEGISPITKMRDTGSPSSDGFLIS